MTRNTAIEHFVEYPLSWKEIQTLPDDQQAALAILSYAVSETNALSKIYMCASHNMIDEAAIDCAASIQRFVILRTWSAKLFEIEEFLNLGGKKKSTVDTALLELANEALARFSTLRNSEGYGLVRAVRHEATSHYSFSAAKKNLKHVSQNANCNMYLHEMNGNSFYPMGEEVMFIGGMNRRGSNLQTKEERSNLLGVWMDWNLEANNWLNETHVSFMKRLVLEAQSGKFARKRSYWIPPEFVGNVAENKMPLLLRKRQKK